MRPRFFPVIAAALLATGCGVGPDQSREDANDTRNVDKTSPEVIAFNNHFPNVETKCDGHGHRIFVTSRGDSGTYFRLVVRADPSCGVSAG